jgi:GPI-anchor transamidase subunit T
MAYLKWYEYPPDSNHGFFVNAAQVTAKFSSIKPLSQFRPMTTQQQLDSIWTSILLKTVNDNKIVNIHSETLVVNLPTPDFSMPYNVICLTCTILAIAFGSIHNFTTRKFIFIEPKSMKDKIIERIGKIFNKKK